MTCYRWQIPSNSRKIWVSDVRVGSDGKPVVVQVPRMPGIPDGILHCSLYLYASVEEARAGEHTGGSGLAVGVSSTVHTGFFFGYAVTNAHVVKRCPVVRYTATNGEITIVPFKADDWILHEDADDVAIASLSATATGVGGTAVPVETLVESGTLARENLRVGVECFMVGRLIGNDGRQRNEPSVRFGNLSMMPTRVNMQESGLQQEGFLVDVRSLSGYSGSPVFVCDYIGRDMHAPIWLLGIDCGHIRRCIPVCGSDGKRVEGLFVSENTGHAVVVPAWKIAEVLQYPIFRAERQKKDAELQAAASNAPGQLDSSPD